MDTQNFADHIKTPINNSDIDFDKAYNIDNIPVKDMTDVIIKKKRGRKPKIQQPIQTERERERESVVTMTTDQVNNGLQGGLSSLLHSNENYDINISNNLTNVSYPAWSLLPVSKESEPIVSMTESISEVPELKKRGRKPTSKIISKSNMDNYFFKEPLDDCLVIQLPISKMDIDKMFSVLPSRDSNQEDNDIFSLKKKDNVSQHMNIPSSEIINQSLSTNISNVANQSLSNYINNSSDMSVSSQKCTHTDEISVPHNVSLGGDTTRKNKKISLNFEEKEIEYTNMNQTKYCNTVDRCINCEHLTTKINDIESKYHLYKINKVDREIYNIQVKLENIYNEDIWETAKDNSICCWWCCHTFDMLPIGLPNKYYENKFNVMGYFCSFNCALAYNLSLNDHKIWDRISLLYHLRNIIFNSIYPDGNIKNLDDIIIAPPRSLLKMFGGKLDINEFREKSIILKKQYRNIIPAVTSSLEQIEETTYNQVQNLLIKPVKMKTFSNTKSGELVLRRTKPISNNKSSLVNMMNIVLESST